MTDDVGWCDVNFLNRRLVNEFREAGIGVSVAKDGVLSQTDVFLASHTPLDSTARHKSSSSAQQQQWGDRPVLVLIGLRLGIDGVNPIYYETIKVCVFYLFIYLFSLSLSCMFSPRVYRRDPRV